MAESTVIKFYICNSFTDKAFEGNPAGVVFDDTRSLSASQMQKIAAQLNMVDTSFVFPSSSHDAVCEMRYFTPLKELPMTGHPTLAAWWVMRHKNRIPVDHSPKIKTPAGVIEVEEIGQETFLSQRKPDFTAISEEDVNMLLTVFSLKKSDLLDFPVMGVNAGLGHIVFGVKNLDILYGLKFGIDGLKTICDRYHLQEAQIFTQDVLDKDNDLHTRNLCPRYGAEDPACGNGNAALGAYYLQFIAQSDRNIMLNAEQGYVMNKPSLVKIRAIKNDSGDYQVKIGGRAVIMAEGTMFL